MTIIVFVINYRVCDHYRLCALPPYANILQADTGITAVQKSNNDISIRGGKHNGYTISVRATLPANSPINHLPALLQQRA